MVALAGHTLVAALCGLIRQHEVYANITRQVAVAMSRVGMRITCWAVVLVVSLEIGK